MMMNKLDGKNIIRAIIKKRVDDVKLYLRDASKDDIIFDINKKNDDGDYPFLMAIDIDCIEIVILIINFANDKNIILKINDKNEHGEYPLLLSINNNNINIVNLVINYTINNSIILDINERSNNGDYPLLCAVKNNNIEIIELILEYAKSNNIILYIAEKDIRIIYDNIEINNEIFTILYKYYNEHILNISFDDNNNESIILNKFKEIKNYSDGFNTTEKTIITETKNSLNDSISDYSSNFSDSSSSLPENLSHISFNENYDNKIDFNDANNMKGKTLFNNINNILKIINIHNTILNN